MNYLVIDFGGTLAKHSVMDEECMVKCQGEGKAPVESKEAFLKFICELYGKYTEGFDIKGIAISMPGMIDEKKGFVKTAGAYMALYGMNLVEELKGRIPVKVTVENDGKCGALAEVWRGNLQECEDGIVLVLGTGIAGGIIKNRRIHKGNSLAAGEFSYILQGGEEGAGKMVLCQCSVSALLYQASRRLGIEAKKIHGHEMWEKLLPGGDEPSQDSCREYTEYSRGINGYEFFELLEKGNEMIAGLYRKYVADLSQLIRNLQLIYAPEKILIGGGISRQPRLLQDIRTACDRLEQIYGEIFPVDCNLDVCALGNESNQYGALYHFLQCSS